MQQTFSTEAGRKMCLQELMFPTPLFSIPSIPFIDISTYVWEDPFFCTKSYSLTRVQ